jgi:hypothetical protein
LSGCSSLKKSSQKPKGPSPFAQFGNYDKVFIPNNAPLISHMISIVQPEIEESSRNTIANNIQKAITKYKVEPQIVVALMIQKVILNTMYLYNWRFIWLSKC